MKLIGKLAVACMALAANSVLAQEVTQAQKDGSARLVTQCVITKAPKDWQAILIALDRSNLEKPTIYNLARVNGVDKFVDINVLGCDYKKQALDLMQFQVLFPKDKDWKVLYLNIDTKQNYRVFTNNSLPKPVAKPQ